MAKDWRCVIGMHRFVRKAYPQVETPSFYRECSRCGKFRDTSPPVPPSAGLS